MSPAIRPNRILFAVETPYLRRDDAVEVMQLALEPGVDDVVAGFSDAVDPKDVPAHNPHMLYAGRKMGKMGLACRTTFDRVWEFVDVVEYVCSEIDYETEAEWTAWFEIDCDLTTDDVNAPDGWSVGIHDVDVGTGVKLQYSDLAVEDGSILRDSFDRVREIMDDVAPDAEPAGEAPEAPVEEYYRVKYGDRLADTGRNVFFQQLFHTSGGFASIDKFDVKREEATLESIDVTVVEESLDESDIQALDERDQKFASVPRGSSYEYLAKLLDGTPTLLEADYAFENSGDRTEETELHLVAREDDEWRLVE